MRPPRLPPITRSDILSYLTCTERQGPFLAQREKTELTEMATERITRAVRSLQDDRVERGVELNRPMHCDSCDREKPSAGSALYGAYKFCNDCLLDFTLALASSSVGNAAEYMTNFDGSEAHLEQLDPPRERHTLPVNLPGRDKLMPRNEPC